MSDSDSEGTFCSDLSDREVASDKIRIRPGFSIGGKSPRVRPNPKSTSHDVPTNVSANKAVSEIKTQANHNRERLPVQNTVIQLSKADKDSIVRECTLAIKNELKGSYDLNYLTMDRVRRDCDIHSEYIETLGSRLIALEEAREEMEDATREAREVISRKRKRTENAEYADDEAEEGPRLRERTHVLEQDQIFSEVRYLLTLASRRL